MTGRRGAWTIPQLLMKIETEQMVFYRHSIRVRFKQNNEFVGYAMIDIFNNNKLPMLDSDLQPYFVTDDVIYTPATGYLNNGNIPIYGIKVRVSQKNLLLCNGTTSIITDIQLLDDTVTTVHLPLAD